MKTQQAAKSGRRAGVLAGAVILWGFVVVSAKNTGGRPGGVPVEGNPPVPTGTILPASLENGLKAEDAGKGELVELRIKQDVPLPNGDKIPVRSKVTGYVASI